MSALLDPHTRLGPVELVVTDLERSAAYYERSIGLRRHGDTTMGAGGEDLLVLHERSDARPQGRHAGLFHFALLHPSRLELGRAVVRLGATGTRIEGASDHGVSEAIYLSDPDGNGIELYADRPREEWPAPGPGARVGMFVDPLDLTDLTAAAWGEEPQRHADEGLVMGHMHLHVSDLDASARFYTEVVGFEVMAALAGASFVAAGGYHHHLGFNTWRGEGIPPAPADAAGLRCWTLVLAGDGELAALADRADAEGVERDEHDGGIVVRDPAGNAMLALAA